MGDAAVERSTTTMFEIEFAIFAAIVFVFALVSHRVERLNVTAPMAFIAGGVLLGASHLFSVWINNGALLLIGSIVLVLVALEEPALAALAPQIATIVLVTVILSVFAHGISAQPGAFMYARRVAAMDSDAPELRDVSQLPARTRRMGK